MELLRTFVKVAEAKSFNKAAEAMFITPSAVIKQINSLEKRLDVRLFNRTHRGLSLTDAGRVFYDDTVRILDYYNEAVLRAKKASGEDDSVIRVGTSLMMPSYFLLDMFPRIHELVPDISFQLIPFINDSESGGEILRNLGRKADIVAGIYDDALLSHYGCTASYVSMKPLCVLVPAKDPLLEKQELEITDLYDRRLFLRSKGWSRTFDTLREDLKRDHPSVIIEDVEEFNMNAFSRCETDGGIMVAIADWENVHPLLRTRSVNWDYEVPFGILHASEPSSKVARLLSAIRQA